MPPNTSSGKTPESITVIWLIAAREQLEELLAQDGRLVGLNHDERAAEVEQQVDVLNDLLRKTFSSRGVEATSPDVEAIVVLKRLGGYSPKTNQHVLRIEVRRGAQDDSGIGKASEAHVVKVGPVEKLGKELEGRKSCQRQANERGRTLLNVRKGWFPDEAANDDSQGTLIYQDAHHTLRAARVVSLETAVLDCVRWGVPSPWSILFVLDQVFAELQDQCYAAAPSVQPSEQTLRRLRDKLAGGAKRWLNAHSVPGEQRQHARELLPPCTLPFVDVLHFAQRATAHVSYLPDFRQGPSHGDMNGRNVFVGLLDGEARFPAVFDFEDMGADNFVAWDFVKLEVELKIRALQCVFPQGNAEFVRKVYDFEQKLNELTEDLNQQDFDSWQDGAGIDRGTPCGRLLMLCLGLRRRAKKHLDESGPLTRDRSWLHEYYFFLACYVAHAGKFSYDPRECLAAYLVGSCAATRYVWGQEGKLATAAERAARAQQQVLIDDLLKGQVLGEAAQAPGTDRSNDDCAEPGDAEDDAARASEPWDMQLEYLKALARSRSAAHVQDAAEKLCRLLQQVPTAPEIVQERALALLELADLTGDAGFVRKAIEELCAFERYQHGHYSRDVELLCRWGRLFKDLGDRALEPERPFEEKSQDDVETDSRASSARVSSSGPLKATQWYQLAAMYYRRAYEVSNDYYPGINLATLEYLVLALDESQAGQADEKRAKRCAESVRKELESQLKLAAAESSTSAQQGARKDYGAVDDAHWRLATLGEACLLLGDDSAVEYYTRAWKHKNIDTHARAAMQKQACRIIQCQKKRDPESMKEIHEKLEQLFRAAAPSS